MFLSDWFTVLIKGRIYIPKVSIYEQKKKNSQN